MGHYSVRPGQLVYINDSTIFPAEGDNNIAQDELHRRETEVNFRLFTVDVDPLSEAQTSLLNKENIDISVLGYSARFGADLSTYVNLDLITEVPKIRSPLGVFVRRDPENTYGCDPFEQTYPDSMLIVHRGDCTFLEKLLHARDALAAGILIISDEESGINPTANADELIEAGDLSGVAVILLPKKAGQAVEELVLLTEKLHSSQIRIALQEPHHSDIEQTSPPEREEEPKDPNRILYINGHPLINTRLLI